MSGIGRADRNGVASVGMTAISRDGLGPEHMIEIQRVRMLAAMIEECGEWGPGRVTVAGVVERAGVSRRTFYEIFDDCEDCLLAALEEGLRRASECVLPAYRDNARWLERVRVSLVAFLEFLDVEPVMGCLLIVGSLGAGPRALEYRRGVLEQIVVAVDDGRGESKAAKQPPPLTAEGVVGGVLSILHARLLASPPSSEDGSLLELTGPLMSMIVLPYLGSAAARRELERPVPKRRNPDRVVQGDPLRDLGLRLTYRTVRALVSVADMPGSSNREIGQAAGIADQGQMSKLLWRLERTGLIQNTGLGPGTGAPNVWTLTERGEAIHHAIVSRRTTAA
jgi:AcrR family transcriptional regulator